MTHHHHHPHAHHPIQPGGPSFLRLSAAGRLILAIGVSAVLWGAILWAMA